MSEGECRIKCENERTANERGAALMDALVRRAFSAADDLNAGAGLGL